MSSRRIRSVDELRGVAVGNVLVTADGTTAYRRTGPGKTEWESVRFGSTSFVPTEPRRVGSHAFVALTKVLASEPMVETVPAAVYGRVSGRNLTPGEIASARAQVSRIERLRRSARGRARLAREACGGSRECVRANADYIRGSAERIRGRVGGTAMQISYFSHGGFVVHKAVDGKTSAWFDANGRLLDAERRDRAGRRTDRISAATREKLESIGRVHAKPTAGRAGGRHSRSARNPDATNREGMKWSEFFNATQPSRTPVEELHAAWERGEDPSEYRGSGGRRYHTAFFHKISNPGGKPTPDRDVVLSDSDFADKNKLAAALRVGRVLAPGEGLSAVRREGNRVVAFSRGRAVWHSLIITPA